MKQIRYVALALMLCVLIGGISACSGTAEGASAAGKLGRGSGQGAASNLAAGAGSANAQDGQAYAASMSEKGKGPKDDKGNNGNGNGIGKSKSKSNNGKGNNDAKANVPPAQAANGKGSRPADVTGPSANRGNADAAKATGWQFGRYKDMLDFAYPEGWTSRKQGDNLVLSGNWNGHGYVVEVSRAMKVSADNLHDFVQNDLAGLAVTDANVQYIEMNGRQVALVSGLDLPNDDYDCPVTRAYIWLENPAGNNERVVEVNVGQTAGEACNPEVVANFVDAFRQGLVGGTPSSDAGPRAGATPSATRTPQAGWQPAHFTDVFTFATQNGWRMERQNGVNILTGEWNDRAYRVELSQSANTGAANLRDWVGRDLSATGVSLSGVQYYQSGQVQAAVVNGVRDSRYACPVARIYLWSQSTVGMGPQPMLVTVSQASGQQCDPAALQRLVNQFVTP